MGDTVVISRLIQRLEELEARVLALEARVRELDQRTIMSVRLGPGK